jgi:superfamily II DNA or RNA helicase
LRAKIVIKDEVNVKLEGLEIGMRKKIADKFKYEIPGARYQPAVRLGRWDGKVAFAQLGGSTYINLLPEILPMLDAGGYDIELADLRDYQTNFDLPVIAEDTFADTLWPKGHVAEGEPIMLRDYQVQILNTFFENPQSIQEVATGAGKTIMTAALSKSIEQYGRSIIIVPNKSLVTQTEDDYVNLGLDVGVYFGDRKDFGRQHTICTWQSLNNLLKDTKNGVADIEISEFIEDVVCVITDEVHMAKADALKTLLTSVFAKVPLRWGFTGTIPKEEYAKVSLVCSIGPIVGSLKAVELQDAGHLAQCHVKVLQLIDHAEFKEYQAELKYLTETTERIAFMARKIEKICQSGNTLILVDRIASGKILQAELSSLFSLLGDKPDVPFISGVTKASDRKEEYDTIATATNKVFIATYGVAAVGINIPRIFNLVLFEPGKSFVRVIQSIGRGIRKAEDKDFVQIWDVTSTCKFSKRHLTARKKFYTEASYPYSIEKVEWK